MDIGSLKSDWAAWLALLLSLFVAAFVMRALFQGSSRGQLNQALRNHRQAEKALLNAKKVAEKAAVKLEKLTAKSDKVQPRILQETRETLADLRALEKIHDDKCQVTMNHLRRVIFEEFPPSHHEKMRRKFLSQDVKDGRPFSF